ncbi:MAG: serine/threonine protein kinase [Polyangiaceae bacterium]|nr:serine/threonine protein kinase [Polyangiaceae bacterium]
MGKVLAGRYEMLKPLAAGGMAMVHLGRALGVGGFERLVAIKLMHHHISAEPEFVTMFLDEARLAARIRHPNVVPTLDVQESPDGLFLIMEYIEGASLHQILRSAGQRPGIVPLGVVLRVMLDMLAGLHCAHELVDDEGAPLSLVHRDVSPANVLLGTDGVARITDFGVARAEARLSSTRGGQLKGKLPYMPPEQLMNDSVDRRADVYAAGALMWEVLIGRRLFQADSDGATLNLIMAGPSATPRQIDPTIPAAIDEACMRALDKRREGRYATAADFSEALEQAAHASGVTIASARVVAAFVESSGAFKKMHPKELAALKKGIVEPTPATRSGRGSASGARSGPAVEQPKSAPTAPSQVTSAGSALSTPTAPERGRRYGVGIVVAVALGVAGGILVWRNLDGSTKGVATSASEPPTQASNTTPIEPTVLPAASAESTSTASAATAQPSADAVASTSASASPVGSPVRVPAGGGRRPATTATPKVPATAYDPDRL